MLHQFYPDYEADSAYGIDYRTLYEQGSVSYTHLTLPTIA